MNPHIGSDFDSFLAEEGILDEVTGTAIERISFGTRCWWCCREIQPGEACCRVEDKLD